MPQLYLSVDQLCKRLLEFKYVNKIDIYMYVNHTQNLKCTLLWHENESEKDFYSGCYPDTIGALFC